MKTIKCPNKKCDETITIDVSKSLDSEGEVYICPKCRKKFRFTEK